MFQKLTAFIAAVAFAATAAAPASSSPTNDGTLFISADGNGRAVATIVDADILQGTFHAPGTHPFVVTFVEQDVNPATAAMIVIGRPEGSPRIRVQTHGAALAASDDHSLGLLKGQYLVTVVSETPVTLTATVKNAAPIRLTRWSASDAEFTTEDDDAVRAGGFYAGGHRHSGASDSITIQLARATGDATIVDRTEMCLYLGEPSAVAWMPGCPSLYRMGPEAQVRVNTDLHPTPYEFELFGSFVRIGYGHGAGFNIQSGSPLMSVSNLSVTIPLTL